MLKLKVCFIHPRRREWRSEYPFSNQLCSTSKKNLSIPSFHFNFFKWIAIKFTFQIEVSFTPSTFYQQFLCTQIQKAQKDLQLDCLFLRFWDLFKENLLIECWWNWHQGWAIFLRLLIFWKFSDLSPFPLVTF